MKANPLKPVRCANYTRVSTDQGLDQEFISQDAQYDASSAHIKSQAHAGWTLIKARYNGGYLRTIGTAPGTGILGPETKGRNRRISANGDRDPSERR